MDVMNVEALNRRMEVVNSKVKQLNGTRQMNIGRLNTLQQQLQTATDNYRIKYGVDITAQNIDSELQRVVAEKERECAFLEGVFEKIDAGDFAGANAMVEGGVAESSEVVENRQSAVQSPHAVGEQAPQSGGQVGSQAVVQAPTQAPAQAPQASQVAQAPQGVPQPSSFAQYTSVNQPASTGNVAGFTGMNPPQGVGLVGVPPMPQTPNVGSQSSEEQDVSAPPTPPAAPPTFAREEPKKTLSGLDIPAPPNGGRVAPPPTVTKGLGAASQTTASAPKAQNPTSFGGILSGTEFKA